MEAIGDIKYRSLVTLAAFCPYLQHFDSCQPSVVIVPVPCRVMCVGGHQDYA